MSVGRSVGWLVGRSVGRVTHSFDDPHVAPYWATWPCLLQDGDKVLSAEERRNMLEDLQDKKEDIDNKQKQLEEQQTHQEQLQKQNSRGKYQRQSAKVITSAAKN